MTTLAIARGRTAEFRLHPLGFFYLQDRLASGENRRIHVWLSAGKDPPENDRHQHSFDIHSHVLVGRMRSELFRFRETPSGTEREFAVGYRENRSILSATGRIGALEVFCAFDSAAGTSYFLEAGIIHRVTITERPCVTILTTKEHGIPIFSYGKESTERPFDRRLVNANEAQDIEQLLGAITEGAARMPH
jgi:hypothetical protein